MDLRALFPIFYKNGAFFTNFYINIRFTFSNIGFFMIYRFILLLTLLSSNYLSAKAQFA